MIHGGVGRKHDPPLFFGDSIIWTRRDLLILSAASTFSLPAQLIANGTTHWIGWTGRLDPKSPRPPFPNHDWIGDPHVWKALWTVLFPEAPAPEIDFTKQAVVVALGTQDFPTIVMRDQQWSWPSLSSDPTQNPKEFALQLVERIPLTSVQGMPIGIGVQPKRGSQLWKLKSFDRGILVDFGKADPIDQATLWREGDNWPQRIQWSASLRGLESLSCSCGDHRIEWNFHSSGPQPLSIQVDGSPQEGKSLEFFRETVVSPEEKVLKESLRKAISPREPQTFTVELPSNWLKESPESIKWEWIDFYR
jgi:hypothetical protein